jgi:hypothetical protein
LEIDRSSRGDVLHMGFSDSPIPFAPHPEGKDGLGQGAFDARTAFIDVFERVGVLAFARGLQGQLLRFRVQREFSRPGFTSGTSRTYRARRTGLLFK